MALPASRGEWASPDHPIVKKATRWCGHRTREKKYRSRKIRGEALEWRTARTTISVARRYLRQESTAPSSASTARARAICLREKEGRGFLAFPFVCHCLQDFVARFANDDFFRRHC